MSNFVKTSVTAHQLCRCVVPSASPIPTKSSIINISPAILAMRNSDGEESEKTPPNQPKGKNSEKNKRKRNRNRKKNGAKVENLVSKTFQAKLVANSCPPENTTVNQVSLKSDVKVEDQECVKEVSGNIRKNISPFKKSSPTNKPLSPKKNLPEKNCDTEPEIQNSVSTAFKSISPNKTNFGRAEPISKIPESIKKATAPDIASSNMIQTRVAEPALAEKSREEILAEREAKKLAKQQAKLKNKSEKSQTNPVAPGKIPGYLNKLEDNPLSNEDSSNHKHKKDNNQSVTNLITNTTLVTEILGDIVISETSNIGYAKITDKKCVLTKADRRAIQEAQRAAKKDTAIKKHNTKSANILANGKKTATQPKEVLVGPTEKLSVTKSPKDCKVKLFNHLESCRKESNLFVNNTHIHPVIVRLGEQYAKRTIVGSNARCISFLSSLKTVIEDYETPAKKEFARSLEATIKIAVDHLHKCRPLAVSVWNAYKHIKHVLTQLSVDQPESELKEHLCHFVDTYIENQIGKAAEAISISVQDKISNGDVILTFGCSSLINYIFEEAHRRHVDFRVIVVDSRPFSEGQELLRRLTAKEIPCTYVLINAVGFVMPEVTKILLGAHALLSNGYVMARTGTAQVALVARSFNVPVLVCCETHKFSERFQTDAIVYNELGNPDDLIMGDKCRLMNWQSQNKLSPLNLNYDITPPELVTAVVTEVAILPCTSVPVILRIKPTEIGY